MSINLDKRNKTTLILTGPCGDQANFHGILNRIRDPDLKLISVYLDEESKND